MSNEDDRQAREIVRQSRPSAAGSRLMAGSAGSTSAPLAASLTHVEGGQVKRLFLMGDPWTDRYYFKEWRGDA